MAPYDEWNRLDDDDDEELQDGSWFEGKRDVILFAIDCSESMLELRDDPEYEDVKTCHLLTALESAMQVQKKKVLVGPNDAVGIMLFNTTRKNEGSGQGADIKKGTFVFQPIETINAPKIQELIQLLDAAREDSNLLRDTFPPLADGRVPMGDVFTSCNWVMRDGAPKTATKRVFLITDEDDPHPGAAKDRLITSARTTLTDLTQAGIIVEPFFISTEDKPFLTSKFYSSVLLPTNLTDDDENDSEVLPESMSITRIEDLLAQMRIHEMPKRALFSIPFELAENFVIGIKGYGLVTEQKKGSYRYFADLGDRMAPVATRSAYIDPNEVHKDDILYGMSLGETAAAPEQVDEESMDITGGGAARTVPLGNKVFYTADEIKSFRTLGLDPGLKLLGFKSRKELVFEDNIKHSVFIYPDEMSYSGSKRTFTALLKTMIKKKRIGLVRALMRRNSSPVFCAMIPQAENAEEGGWNEPAGFHLIPLPFADDIRAATVQTAARASEELREAARLWIEKLSVKNGAYPPDSYPNPALAYHNAQLEASAFREEFDPESFEDLTLPKYDIIHKRAGQLMKAWKEALLNDESASMIPEPTVKRTSRKTDVTVDEADIRKKYEDGELSKLRVDQLKDVANKKKVSDTVCMATHVHVSQEFLKSKSMSVSGKKAELIDRVGEYLDTHTK
ncbi:hypothetical protein NM688_g3122 [Phlebia brevispora]|uniref:Uncharacterized protein n=1 Tax=Phlebia brevispora TaxID=194682 RepID=A0ACC1T6U9_9APHY|nr:hypothetical protein NM688_g3122 [Phlebia brevispora]